MAKGRKSFYSILIWTFSALIPVWVYVSKLLVRILEKEHKLASKIIASDGILILFIAVLVVSNILKGISEGSSRKENLEHYLKILHERYFPHEVGKKHPDYRITLFVPNWYKQLKPYVQSGNPPLSGTKWSIKKSENAAREQDYDGIIGYAWSKGIIVIKDDLPDYTKATLADKDLYLKQLFLNKEKIKKLKWQSRSYRCLVIKNKIGDQVGALVMESMVDPKGLTKITPKLFTEIAENLQCFF